MNYCKDCHYAKALRTFGEPEFQCLSSKLKQGYFGKHAPDQLRYEYDEGGSFYVGPEFGCVHWKKREPVLSRTYADIIKEVARLSQDFQAASGKSPSVLEIGLQEAVAIITGLNEEPYLSATPMGAAEFIGDLASRKAKIRLMGLKIELKIELAGFYGSLLRVR